MDAVNRKDYYDKLRDVLERFGQTTIKREKPISEFEDRQRQTLLKKVWDFWIEGFLKPSLYFNTAVDTWEQNQQPLEEWLSEELKDKYQVPKTWSEPWIKKQQLILLLDGLDEVGAGLELGARLEGKSQAIELRNACVRAINKFIANHLETEIVVCSRVNDYKALTERLQLSSAICIQPLSKQQLLDFLDNADDSLWGLKTVIEEDEEIAKFAQTPLLLNMMTWTYQGWLAEQCRKQFRIARDRKFNLFESYIEKNLEQENQVKKPTEYTTRKVRFWFRWLAKKMVDESKIIFLIEKMQPTLLENGREKKGYQIRNFLLGGLSVGLSVELIFGLIGGLNEEGLSVGLSVELIFGLVFGLIGGVIAGLSKEITLFEQMNWSWQRAKSRLLRDVLIFGLSFGLSFGLIGGLIFELIGGLSGGGLSVELIFGLSVELIFGLSVGLKSGLGSNEVKQRTLPNQGIWSSRKNSVRMGLIFGLSVGLIFGLSVGLKSGLNGGLNGGLVFGLIGGLSGGLLHGGVTCIQHFNLRRILYRKGRIPWNYAKFLDYASERLLMKKVGGGYIFYHRMLMEHFAQRYPE
ncbi:MAG: NACHT domain-containing NTPase [Xenococcaceae cyanobacterium]